jgi:hypothetical protein
MPTLLARLCGAVLTVPLVICKPILRFMEKRKRRPRLRPPGPAGKGGSSKPVPGATPLPQRATSAAMRSMRDELRRVLDEREANRHVFRHLARFERKFAKSGLRAIDEIPVDHLRRALADFEGLVINWSSASLADLRSRMAVTLTDRMSAASVWVAANSVSAAHHGLPAEALAARLKRKEAEPARPGAALDVNEISLSRFEAAGGQWKIGGQAG